MFYALMRIVLYSRPFLIHDLSPDL